MKLRPYQAEVAKAVMDSIQNRKETEIRRQDHARAILWGITMRQTVYKALELWLKEESNAQTRA